MFWHFILLTCGYFLELGLQTQFSIWLIFVICNGISHWNFIHIITVALYLQLWGCGVFELEKGNGCSLSFPLKARFYSNCQFGFFSQFPKLSNNHSAVKTENWQYIKMKTMNVKWSLYVNFTRGYMANTEKHFYSISLWKKDEYIWNWQYRITNARVC